MSLGLAPPPSMMTRLGRRVEVIGDCWIIDGQPDTYALASGPYGRVNANRFVYQQVHGVVLDATVHVHHTCEHPGCIRPEHLVAMTNGDHARLHAGTATLDEVAIDPRRL